MPVPSIESVNSTSASNIGDLLQEGDFQKGIKIIAFVFLMLLSMLGNALLIAVVYKNANQRMRTPSNYFIFNMACADVLLTVYTVPVSIVSTAYSHQWLITGVAGELLCRLSQFIGQMSVLVSTGSLLVTALDRFFSGVLSTQENDNSSYRSVSDWPHLDFCDRVHGAVIQNDHFSRIQAGPSCLFLQFWNH